MKPGPHFTGLLSPAAIRGLFPLAFPGFISSVVGENFAPVCLLLMVAAGEEEEGERGQRGQAGAAVVPIMGRRRSSGGS